MSAGELEAIRRYLLENVEVDGAEELDTFEQVRDVVMSMESWQQLAMSRLNDLTLARAALRYISSPTMGLPAGVDAREFAMSGSSERNARYALQLCIGQARDALLKIGNDV